jgi:hypothetical protein
MGRSRSVGAAGIGPIVALDEGTVTFVVPPAGGACNH